MEALLRALGCDMAFVQVSSSFSWTSEEIPCGLEGTF